MGESRIESRVQFVTPLPPLPTGISAYSTDLLNAIGDGWDVRVLPEPGSDISRLTSPERLPTRSQFDPEYPTVLQLGNSDFHPRAFTLASQLDAVVVLHDVVLHHARMIDAVRRGKTKQYRAELLERYGRSGLTLGDDLIHGKQVDEIVDFPLSESYVERARLTVVHNSYARGRIEAFDPGAEVHRVPMGIPLPSQVAKQEARRELGLPATAFIVASITHINPYKRLDVVLRAIRRIVGRVPETQFIVAGTPSPEVPLDRQAWMLGLESYVQIRGYLGNREARLLAQAADVCVNLRYPLLGETSASLLRLLGAGRPVIVTEGPLTIDIPSGACFPVPVDCYEEETIAELLVALAGDDNLRRSVGETAREFVLAEHSMQRSIDGYRRAINRAYGVTLPRIPSALEHEELPLPPGEAHDSNTRDRSFVSISRFHTEVAGALHSLGLHQSKTLMNDAASASVALGLDQLKATYDVDRDLRRPIPSRLMKRVECSNCRSTLITIDGILACRACGVRFEQTFNAVDMRTG